MFYVYILQSINRPDQIYIGCTENLERRLAEHNTGNTFHTNKYSPWKLLIYVVIEDKSKAYEFEEYLKSGSGRSFLYKRLIGALPEAKINKSLQVAAIEQFLNFASKRFGVYLATIFGFRNNFNLIDNAQKRTSQLLKIPVVELDKRSFFQAKCNPPTELEMLEEKSLHKMTQCEFKIANSPGGINETFAIYNCLSDIYNQWKLLRADICIDDMEVPVLAYLAAIRNRANHELFDTDGYVLANTTIKMDNTISDYSFPIFEKGSRLILSDDDTCALIKEIKLQLNEKIKII